MTGQDNNAKSKKLQNRYFSEEFKKQKVKELEQKLISIKDLVDLHQISRTTVYQWLHKYSTHYQRDTKIVVQMESESLKTKQLLERQAELERIIGQKQIEIDFLNKLMEIASQELNIDLKKSFLDKLSTGSGQIKTNTSGK
ncbi:MAG: transposase [Thermoflexibacter sp.]|nr:transposase [Thermoflexibacter sp.]